MEKVTSHYQHPETQAEEENTQVDIHHNNPKQSIKSGHVRYDDLTQFQWTSGLTAIAAEETNPEVQRNVFKYLAYLHQDVCDYGLQSAMGSHAIMLSYLEEGRSNGTTYQ